MPEIPSTPQAVTKAMAIVQHPSALKKLQDVLDTPRPHLDETSLEYGIEGVFEDPEVETRVCWCRFPAIITDLMDAVVRDPDRPYGGVRAAFIRHAVYELLMQIAKEDKGDVPSSSLMQYIRSQRLLARKAFEAGSERTQEAAIHAIEILLGRAVDNEMPEDIHKELADLDELMKGSTHETWKAEFKKRLRESGMIARAVSYLADKWQDGTPRQREHADAWVSWWENL